MQLLAIPSGDNLIERQHLFLTDGRVAFAANGVGYLFGAGGSQVGTFNVSADETIGGTVGDDLLINSTSGTRSIVEVNLSAGYSARVYQLNGIGERGYPGTITF